MHRLIRYNNWQHDPISDNYAGNAVASRYDLNPASPSAFGAIDAKVRRRAGASCAWGLRTHRTCASAQMTCAFMRGELVASAISGPTSDQQPVFDWNDKFSKVVRTGVPDRFDFPWTEMSSF